VTWESVKRRKTMTKKQKKGRRKRCSPESMDEGSQIHKRGIEVRGRPEIIHKKTEVILRG